MSNENETTVAVEEVAEKIEPKKAKKPKKVSKKKQKKLEKKARKKEKKSAKKAVKKEKRAAKKEKKIAKKYPKKEKKFNKKVAKAQKKYDKKQAKAQKKGKEAKRPKILDKEFVYPKPKKEYPELEGLKGWPLFVGKLKARFYIENPKHRMLALILAIVVFLSIVAGSIGGAVSSKKQREWNESIYSQLEEIQTKLNTITVLYGGIPKHETSIQKIQRQLDQIIILLGGEVKYSSASAEEIEEQIEDIENQVDSEVADSEDENNDGAVSEDTASSSSDSSGSSAQTAEKTTKKSSDKKSTVPSTTKEIVEYCNTALNKVKSSKAGYNKKYVMTVKGDVNGLPSWLTNLAKKNETSTVKKGENSNDSFPAAGYSWSSKLTEKDVKSATLNVSGNTYKIRLTIVEEDNPAKGEASHHGRVMSVIDAKDVLDMSSLIKSAKMHYHNGYVYAEIDSKTGKVLKAEFSAAADVALNVAVLGDVAVSDIVSTETFTDFVW